MPFKTLYFGPLPLDSSHFPCLPFEFVFQSQGALPFHPTRIGPKPVQETWDWLLLYPILLLFYMALARKRVPWVFLWQKTITASSLSLSIEPVERLQRVESGQMPSVNKFLKSALRVREKSAGKSASEPRGKERVKSQFRAYSHSFLW